MQKCEVCGKKNIPTSKVYTQGYICDQCLKVALDRERENKGG